MRNILLVLIVSIFFSGCVISDKNQNISNQKTIFPILVNRLSKKVCSNINNNSVLYVTDFVNESNLKNISQLGFLLSNELKVSILKRSCTKNVSLKEFQLSKSLQIGKQGSRVLTRDLDSLKIKSLKDDRQILVGTYILTKKQLVLFLKLINLREGNTISSSSISSSITDEIKELEGIDTNTDPIIYKPFHL